MAIPESAVGLETALSWKTYNVRRAEKALLLRFIVDALRMRGCEVLYASDPARAPFYIVFETPAAERHGVLAYAFFANSKVTMNRPDDEHRFQIKYGRQLEGILEVAIDPPSNDYLPRHRSGAGRVHRRRSSHEQPVAYVALGGVQGAQCGGNTRFGLVRLGAGAQGSKDQDAADR